MPNAKLSCNSFYMFMLEVKKREEARGRRFPRGLDDVNPLASAEWERMSAEAKTIYKDKAREYKSSEEFRAKKKQSRYRPKSTKMKHKNSNDSSSEESFDDEDHSLFYDAEDEEKFCRRREQDRNNFKTAIIWNLGADSIAKKIANEPLYIFATQNYYETPDHDYGPAEIAIVEFSLARGILKQFSAILKPIRIPDHYRNAVGLKAMETHKIFPTRLPKEARDDYRGVVENVKHFYVHLKQFNQFRAFVLSQQFNSVQGAVKALRDKTGSKCFIPHDKVACVEDLFILLCSFNDSNAKRSDLMGFSELLMETNWDYEPHTLCYYHNSCQSKFCALAIARKTCYYLFERTKEIFGLSLTSSHIPPLPFGKRYRSPISNLVETRDVRPSSLSQANFLPSTTEFQIKPIRFPRKPAEVSQNLNMSNNNVPSPQKENFLYAPVSRSISSTPSKLSSEMVSVAPIQKMASGDSCDHVPMSMNDAHKYPNFSIPNSCNSTSGRSCAKLKVSEAGPRLPNMQQTFSSVPHHFSSSNAAFAPAFQKPVFIDSPALELRRPTTKSFCAKLLEEKRLKARGGCEEAKSSYD